VSCSGSQVVTVAGNTTYTLTASGEGGEATASSSVAAALPPRKEHSGRVIHSGRAQ
jgi:hypothetical protein